MSGAGSTALAALQSSIAIICIILAGYAARKYNLLNEHGETQISFLCNNLFLPLLMISQVGPNFSASDGNKIVPLFAFAAVEMLLGYLLGKFAQRYLNSPRWIVIALMFNNTTALPLLLARNLKETGTMSQLLKGSDDTASDALDRLESYILINAVFHSVLRFGLGPYLMKSDKSKDEEAAETPDAEYESAEADVPRGDLEETSALLPHRRPYVPEETKGFFAVTRRYSKQTYRRTMSWMNPAVMGALVAILLGVIPFTHREFFNKSGVFKSNVMQAVKQLGDLIPALLPFAVGSKLFSKPTTNSGWIAMTYLIVVRFALLPALSILAVWLAKRHNRAFWLEDPAFDFALILSGAGPPAITMISVVEMAAVSEEVVGQVARVLIISYLATPAMVGTVTAGLAVIKILYT